MEEASSFVYRLPPRVELSDYLIGTWKRNLAWKRFGMGFDHLKDTNSIVRIEEDTDAAAEPGTKFLKWSFGRSLQKHELKKAYSIQYIPDERGMLMEWVLDGVKCRGMFQHQTAAALYHFYLENAMVTITYRIIDQNTMAVVVVDISTEHTAVIQHGNMYRIDPSEYETALEKKGI